MASASAASSDCGSAFGSSTPTINLICAFSAWPAPTMVFFTRFGAYSATLQACLGGHQHRDAPRLPELQRRDRVAVDECRLDGRFVGLEVLDDARKPVMDRHQPLGERELVVRSRPSRRPGRSAGCPRSRSSPSRCGAGPGRCRECESPVPSRPVDSASDPRPVRQAHEFPAGFHDRPSRPADAVGRALRPPLHRRRR